jgi:alpha-galactosidase
MMNREPTRRTFLRGAAAVGGTLIASPKPVISDLAVGYGDGAGSTNGDILRQPDSVTAYSGPGSPFPLSRQNEEWSKSGIVVSLNGGSSGSEWAIHLSSPSTALSHLHLRWDLRIPATLRCLGDAWERSYGDLEWRGIVAERVMPWYFLTFDDHLLRGYGVRTQPAAFCFWQLDQGGISLWADIRNGGMSLLLADRHLMVATIVSRTSQPGETPFAAAQAFCRMMCPSPRLPMGPLYGSNDWYYAYGRNTADGILRDADLIARIAPSSGPRPFITVDDGWQDPSRFPSMSDLATRIRGKGLRPGMWIRPLRAPADAKPSLLLPNARFGNQRPSPAWDPTVPEAMERVLESLTTPVSWGYELIKHDFSTFELLGRWGSSMGALPTDGRWQFSDRSRTTAEIILAFYLSLRAAAGEKTVLLACNTVGHLGAGIFESHRIGDDNSGTNWERTRRMGVNTLGMRLPQHRTFFCADPDCVALSRDIGWTETRQWLDLVSRSGTSLFISPEPGAAGPDQIAALTQAFDFVRNCHGYPEDWLDTTTPQQWRFDSADSRITRYNWSDATGASPFAV